MNARRWIMVAALVGLALTYVIGFTEWLRPAPIEIASQVRFSIQPPRFGRSAPKTVKAAPNGFSVRQDQVVKIGPGTKMPDGLPPGTTVQMLPPEQSSDASGSNRTYQVIYRRQITNGLVRKETKPASKSMTEQFERIGAPPKGSIDQAPGGAANVTFSLDNWYQLTKLRVEDVPADGSVPKVMWQLVGKSVPVNSLLYGREPTGMKPLLTGAFAEPLVPGAPYRLIIEAGRRRGTNSFTTVALAPAE